MRIRELALGSCALLLGCGSCDGERAKPVANKPGTVALAGGDARVLEDAAAIVVDALPPTIGYLDASPASLDGLFQGFAAAEQGEANGRALVLFFGDSHTAGDSMTGRVRATLQSRFGDAGRGLVGAGHPPTKHYYQRDVKYGTTGSWRAHVGGKRGDGEPFGIVGVRVTGTQKGAQLWVETCPECLAGTSVGQFEILYYAAPDHGLLRYRVDEGAWQQLSTKTRPIEPPHPARQVVPVPEGPHRLTLEHGGGGVLDLFGVGMERLRPGALVDSLGVVGRRLGSLRSWDWSIIGEQLSTRDPRLVVLQYGTNEADDPDLDLEAFAHYYDETILRIRAAAPTASILILGPPDMGVREGGRSCDRMHARPDVIIPECEWRTPNVLGEIIAVEHAAAIRNRVAFFDTFAAMGGADHMHPWVVGDPKVAYKDHVHFTDLGYQIWGDALTGAVLTAYDRWRAAQHLPPSRPVAPPPKRTTSDAPLPGPIAP